MLDIGCGNGDISEYFAKSNRVEGIDVQDIRRERNDSFHFQIVDSVRLPFKDSLFDIVLSNHVIEHVADQHLHLREIRRVLKPTGVIYMATPNAGSPFMKGHVGNNQVLNLDQMHRLFREHGLQIAEYTTRMLKEPATFHLPMQVGRWIPERIIRAMRPIIPSHVFILTP
jgi:ubiquinone/menaquinone biosynthesis C-methylase UbiE